jgi:hypothetical protein
MNVWVLSHEGFDGQQRAEPDSPDRPNNLWAPVPKDFGAHGPFNKIARKSSLQLWADLHKGALAFAGILAIGGWALMNATRGRKQLT